MTRKMQKPQTFQYTTSRVLVSLYDTKTERYEIPFYSHTTADAIRSFESEIQNPQKTSTLSQCPSDFELKLLGTFYDNGKLDTLHAPVTLVKGEQYRLPQKE